jgi:hypothetical protein
MANHNLIQNDGFYKLTHCGTSVTFRTIKYRARCIVERRMQPIYTRVLLVLFYNLSQPKAMGKMNEVPLFPFKLV